MRQFNSVKVSNETDAAQVQVQRENHPKHNSRTPTTSLNEQKSYITVINLQLKAQTQITEAAGLALFSTVAAYSRSFVRGGSAYRCRIYRFLSL